MSHLIVPDPTLVPIRRAFRFEPRTVPEWIRIFPPHAVGVSAYRMQGTMSWERRALRANGSRIALVQFQWRDAVGQFTAWITADGPVHVGGDRQEAPPGFLAEIVAPEAPTFRAGGMVLRSAVVPTLLDRLDRAVGAIIGYTPEDFRPPPPAPDPYDPVELDRDRLS